MSILREVIKSVEEVEWSKLTEKLPILITNVHLCKSEIFKMLNDVYIEFVQKPVKIAHYSNNLLEFEKQLEVLSLNCEQGLKREAHSSHKINDYKSLSEQLHTTIEILNEVNRCYRIHEKFVDLQLYKYDCEKSLQILKEIEETMENANSDILLKYYRKHFKLTESALHLHFGEVIKTKFIFEVKEENCTSYLRVKKNINIENSLQILVHYQVPIKQLEELIEFLWEFIFVPIVTSDVSMNLSDNEIKVQIKNTSEPYYENVLKRLHDVINFLKNNFNICIDNFNMVSLIDHIGNQLEDKISPLLISHCFKHMHKPVNEGTILDDIRKQVETLQVDLASVKLVTDDSLLEYAINLHQIHVSKTQEKYFEHIRLIMSKTNHDILKVGSLFPKKWIDAPSDLPSMSISSDVHELLQLTEKMLLDAKKNRILINTMFDIFKFYRKYSTKDVEQMSSREVALLYNNFTFIAHELREWNTLYSNITFEDSNVPLFKEELLIFQIVCEETMENFLKKEVTKIKFHLNKLSVDDQEVCKSFETSINKCLKQIELLKESWFDFLAHTVFNKSIGVCFNVLCDFLKEFILNFDIIDKNLIEKFSKVFNTILKLSEEYFIQVTDLKKFIKCWDSFQALSFVLKSDIVEVEINKYHELLKANFKPFEVKKILKAIFHQIEPRDAILVQLYN